MLRTLRRAAFGLCLPLLAALPVAAHDYSAGSLEIVHPEIPAPMAAAKSAGGYFTIANSGSAEDALIGVEAGFVARAEVHASQTDAAGVTRMIAVPRLAIPAGGRVDLSPGGLHVMLMGLAGPLAVGARLPATLIFEKAGRVAVEFVVSAPAAGAMPMDHSSHGAAPAKP